MSLPKWVEQLASDSVAAPAALGAAVGIFVAIARGVIERRWGTFWQFIGSVTAAVLVGIIVSLALDPMFIPQTLKIAIACAVSYLGDEALAGLRTLGSIVARDPIDAARRVIRAFRGQENGGGNAPKEKSK